MKKIFGTLLLALSATLGANAVELQPTYIRQNTITVTGTGTLEVRPDIAVIHMSVVTRAKVAQEAQEANAIQSQRLIEALRTKYNLGPDDIKTTSYTVTAEYSRTQPPTLEGYVVRHSLAVTMRTLENLGEVLDTAIASGANTIEFIQYSSSRQDELQLQALKIAMTDAQRKAQAIAESVGRNIIRVIRVSQGQYIVENAKQEVEQDAGQDTEILPGNITIIATLTVEYLF